MSTYLNEKKHFNMIESFYLFQCYFRRIHIFLGIYCMNYYFRAPIIFIQFPASCVYFARGAFSDAAAIFFLCKMLNAYLDKRWIFFSQLYFSGLGLTQAMNANLLFIFSKTRNKCTFRHAKC